MTKCKPLLLTLIMVCLLVHTAQAQMVNFIKVIDGDSIIVEAAGRGLEVRLIGVDAPEYKQEFSRKAKEFTLGFCFRQRLRLEFDKEITDRYGRVLAYVYKGDTMLNEEIVKAGLAVTLPVKPNTKYRQLFDKAEAYAKKHKTGFWLQGGLKVTPSEWRRGKKK